MARKPYFDATEQEWLGFKEAGKKLEALNELIKKAKLPPCESQIVGTIVRIYRKDMPVVWLDLVQDDSRLGVYAAFFELNVLQQGTFFSFESAFIMPEFFRQLDARLKAIP